MSVRIQNTENHMTAYLSGEIDHHSAKSLREEIDLATERAKPKRLSLDFSEVSFMDSSGIGLITGRYKLMQAMQGELHIANISPPMRKVMKLSGIDKLAILDNGGNN